MAIEQTSEMRDHIFKQRNIMRIEEVIAWVESKSSQLLWINGHNVLYNLLEPDYHRSMEDTIWFIGSQ